MFGRELAIGSSLNETYRIVRFVGRGGMSEVYEATHERLAGRYAVKLLRSEEAARPESFLRFRREASITSALQHPGIVRVVDFNQTSDGLPFLVTEFLDGKDLAQLIAESAPLPLARVAALVDQVASALDAAHAQGIVHRDLKPSNVFVVTLADGKEIVKVIDFGISKLQQGSEPLTSESALLGTPAYMAPEQVIGNNSVVDARSDQFALAAVAYEMLAKRPAFRGDSLLALVHQIVNSTPPALVAFNPTVTPSANAAIQRALGKLPAQRFSNVRAFAAALSSGSSDSEALALSVTTERERAIPATRRNRTKVALSAIAVGFLVGGITLAALVSKQPRKSERDETPKAEARSESRARPFEPLEMPAPVPEAPALPLPSPTVVTAPPAPRRPAPATPSLAHSVPRVAARPESAPLPNPVGSVHRKPRDRLVEDLDP